MSRKINLIGKKYGRLTVVSEAGKKRKEIAWNCVCECGNNVVVNGYALRSGHTQSCGCFKMDQCKKANTTHGMFYTKLYKTYNNMKNRCYNPHYYLFKHYGAKGITVCEDWLGKEGFDKFHAWSMTHGYKEGLSIDRINNDKGYSPDNCRWTTMKVQQNNRSNNRRIVFNGQDHTMAEWAEILKIKYSILQQHVMNNTYLEFMEGAINGNL